MHLDHIVVGCTDLASGTAWMNATLQVPSGGGGEHAGYGTHNRLWRLDGNRYLELIALQPGVQREHTPLFGLSEPAVQTRLERRPRLLSWVVLAPSGHTDARVIARVPGLVAPVSVRRGAFQWRLAVQADSGLGAGGVMPYIIWWQAPHPTEVLPDTGLSLTALEVQAPDSGPVQSLLADSPGEPVRVTSGETSLCAQLEGPAGPVLID